MSMEKDPFGDYPFGKAALKKINHQSPNFRLYIAERVDEYGTMKLTGSVFRTARRGQYKGQLHVLVPDTAVTVYICSADIAEFEKGKT